MRISVIPQRWPTCRGHVRVGARCRPDVVKDLADLHALGNECDPAHLPTAHPAQQREHFLDSGDHHHPQLVRLRAFGRHQLGRGLERMSQRRHSKHPRPWWLDQSAQRLAWPVVPVSPAQPCAANSEPARQNSDAGACVAAAPAQQCWAISFGGVSCIYRPRRHACLSETRYVVAQRYTRVAPSLRKRFIAKGGRAQ
jgi:hypothetical protein